LRKTVFANDGIFAIILLKPEKKLSFHNIQKKASWQCIMTELWKI